MTTSNLQPVPEKDVRGDDWAMDGSGVPGSDEYVRAIAYRAHLEATYLNRFAHLKALNGSVAAYRALQHKTLPLSSASPPYVEIGF